MQGKEFNLADAKQKFEDYDEDKSGNITLEEFIAKYLKEEEYYKTQIKSLKKMIEEGEKQREEFISRYNVAKVSIV